MVKISTSAKTCLHPLYDQKIKFNSALWKIQFYSNDWKSECIKCDRILSFRNSSSYPSMLKYVAGHSMNCWLGDKIVKDIYFCKRYLSQKLVRGSLVQLLYDWWRGFYLKYFFNCRNHSLPDILCWSQRCRKCHWKHVNSAVSVMSLLHAHIVYLNNINKKMG